jgi:hypothetical protein
VEKQVYRKFATLKSKQTQKYVCYNHFTAQFSLKFISDLDRNCVFFYMTKSLNEYTFAIGSNKQISFSFNKLGQLNYNSNQVNRVVGAPQLQNQNECQPSQANQLNIHTKITDYVQPLVKYIPATATTTAQRQFIRQNQNEYYSQQNFISNNNLMIKKLVPSAHYRQQNARFSLSRIQPAAIRPFYPTFSITTTTTTTTRPSTTTTSTLNPITRPFYRHANRNHNHKLFNNNNVNDGTNFLYNLNNYNNFSYQNLFEMNKHRKKFNSKKSYGSSGAGQQQVARRTYYRY